MEFIKISMDAYIEALDARRDFVEENYGWHIPDIVWDYLIELITECGVIYSHSSPSYVVDNVAVNGDYGNFREYMNEGESREDFIERAERNALAVFPEEEYVIWNL